MPTTVLYGPCLAQIRRGAPAFNSITRILDARQINALTKRMVKILLNFEKENVFTLHQVGLNSTTLFCHK